jgi:hypothetical protein
MGLAVTNIDMVSPSHIQCCPGLTSEEQFSWKTLLWKSGAGRCPVSQQDVYRILSKSPSPLTLRGSRLKVSTKRSPDHLIGGGTVVAKCD